MPAQTSETPLFSAFHIVVLLFFVGVLAPTTAMAQNIDSVLSRSGYSAADRQEITDAIDRYSGMNLPVDVLAQRVSEGVAKHATASRVLEVLRDTASALETARDVLLLSKFGDALLKDVPAWALTSAALESGVQQSAVSEIADASEGVADAYRDAIVLHRSLLDWGLTPAQSLQVAVGISSSQVPADEYPLITSLFTEARALRIPPSTLISRLAAQFPKVKNVRELRARVLY